MECEVEQKMSGAFMARANRRAYAQKVALGSWIEPASERSHLSCDLLLLVLRKCAKVIVLGPY